jgi:hypothetical protein
MSKKENFCYEEAATSIKNDTLATDEDLDPADLPLCWRQFFIGVATAPFRGSGYKGRSAASQILPSAKRRCRFVCMVDNRADSDFWESTSRAERHDDELSYASAFGKHGALGRNVRPSRQRLGSVGPKAVGVQQHAQG